MDGAELEDGEISIRMLSVVIFDHNTCTLIIRYFLFVIHVFLPQGTSRLVDKFIQDMLILDLAVEGPAYLSSPPSHRPS